jgi:prephenate dehydrogenase
MEGSPLGRTRQRFAARVGISGMNTLVVGAGRMGRWFGACLAPDHDIAFADTDVEAAADAADAVGGRTALLEGEGQFDAVCLAVPISAVESAVESHAVRADRAILDISGVMEGPIAAMREAAPDRERASLHPLFAPSNEPGNVACVVEDGGPAVATIREAIAARGNHVFETTAEKHDRSMSTVQARAHAAVFAYALAREDVREEFHTPLSGPLTELVEQVTENTPRVYAEIQSSFPGAEAVAEAARRVAEAAEDPEAFADLYAEAGRELGGESESGSDR